MTAQTSLQLNTSLAKEKRDKGIKKAVDTANRISAEWSEKAYEFMKDYATKNGVFMTEDVRYASQGIVDSNVNQKAWGGIARKAAHKGIIERIGRAEVKNVNANCAYASVWKSLILKY
jgi:hypothetical protein